MSIPKLEELTPDLKKIFDPEKAKLLPMIAKGAAPIPPHILVSAWCYMIDGGFSDLAETAKETLLKYPEKMLLPVLEGELPSWVLLVLGRIWKDNENLLQIILLNAAAPDELFLEVAPTCSEKLTILISNNQERIIEVPQLVLALESNPKNLKSNTDKLRHFLRLSGIGIPGDADGAPIELMAENEAELERQFLENLGEDQEDKLLSFGLSEEQRKSLQAYIQGMGIGAKVKLAFKGNKEARQILIRDPNKLVALGVLKSPKLTDSEIALYCGIKSLGEDVVRVISNNSTWTKNYPVKLSLCFHPKSPLQQSMSFIKFLNMRDLIKVSKDKNIPAPLTKAAKHLVSIKRK